jgi:hypothetical protein
MLATMRRLHPRGPTSRGIAVDADGAMLGPDCVLVRRTPGGYRCLPPDAARRFQDTVFDSPREPDWLHQQCRRIAQALDLGELALAQIYGLHIPVGELDDAGVRKLAAVRLIKAGFDPDEPRIPQGEPGAGQWTYEDGYAKPRETGDGQRGGGSSGGGGDQQPPTDAGGDEANSDRPTMEYRLPIPAERPARAKDRYAVVRQTARWLRQASAIGALYAPEPRVKAVLLAIEGTAWLVEYLPEIRSYYLDGPKTLQELQDAVDDPQPGYEDHHIVEGQYGSRSDRSNALRFGARLESRENLVRIPKWSHIDISAWYSRKNEGFGGMSPRAYLRGRSWDEQYAVGLRALRDVGVLK